MQQRAEIVRLSTQEKWTERQIARRLEIPRATVHYWLAKEFPAGEEGSKRRGRRRVTDEETDREMERLSLENPFWSAKDILHNLADRPDISVDTVRKRLKERGQVCRVASRKPHLLPKHIIQRLRFAVCHFAWGDHEWRNVVFSDEKVFQSNHQGVCRVYRPRGSDRFDERYIAPSNPEVNRFKVNVWAAFGHRYRVIHRVRRPTLDGQYYADRILPLMENHLPGHTFQQDRSPIHTSLVARLWFLQHNVEWMKDWPAKGPDINPIENVWAEILRRMRHQFSPNDQELWENIYATFYAIPEAYFDSLMESMPRRMAAVIEKLGSWTKY